MTDRTKLDHLFNPKSVAIVGVSTNEHDMTNGGRIYLDALLSCKFPGRIYPVNSNGGVIRELKAYANVKDIPDPVDYVICCIPAASVPQLIRDCAAKRVKVVQFLTSGFSETGTEEGRRLEAEICDIACQGGIRLIGPNCVGVYWPKMGISFAPDFPVESGSVAFICQSGGNALYITRFAASRGVRFSKVISYGNACDVDESDLLEYFTTDPETDIIAIYIEGVGNGRRFTKVLKEAAKQKPVVVIKGGQTEAGARAAASHTASLAGSAEAWNGLFQQVGVIRVLTLEEMVDVLVTLLYLPVPRGRRLGYVGMGGGATVLATDSYSAVGFVLPPLPQETQRKLRSLVFDDAGLSLNNPVDFSAPYYLLDLYRAGKAVADYNDFDILIFHLPLSIVSPIHSLPRAMASSLLDGLIRVRHETSKPLALVINNVVDGESWQTAFACVQKCSEAGIPVYFSANSAARSIDGFMSYHEWRSKLAR